MAAIQNHADTLLQSTSPRLLSNPLNYISLTPTTNTITSTSGVLTPSTVTIVANLNGALKGNISWGVSPLVSYTNVGNGISIVSSNIGDGVSIVVTATLIFSGSTYTATTTITRKQTISLSTDGILSGEGGGSITNLNYSKISGGPPVNATSNFFTTSGSNPTGGANGDAHFNNTTNVMWFKVNDIWQRGGTIDASEITVGTLAAARIAANSITADKIAAGTITATHIASGTITGTQISGTTLSAIKADLGTITAGNITGTANLDINGSARFNGATSIGGDTTAGAFNNSLARRVGLIAYSGSGGVAVQAVGGSYEGVYASTTSSIAVSGVASSSGIGVRAQSISGTALAVAGSMTTTSTTLVTNLNADMLDGLHASSFIRTDTGGTLVGTLNIIGTLQTDAFRIDKTPTTGGASAGFPGNNKPGGPSTVKWIDISCDGLTYYLPVWS